MKHALIALALLVMIVPVYGTETQDNPDKVKPQIVVIDEFVGAEKDIGKLPDEFRLVAEALGHTDATYTATKDKLTIGIDVPIIAKGTVLERIAWQSDCPDNSQFSVLTILAKRDTALKAATLAWTRYRHRAPAAPQRTINIRKIAAVMTRNFDVQLDLNKLSTVLRE